MDILKLNEPSWFDSHEERKTEQRKVSGLI